MKITVSIFMHREVLHMILRIHQSLLVNHPQQERNTHQRWVGASPTEACSAEGVRECALHPAHTRPKAGVGEDLSAGIFTAVGHL